MTSHSSPKPRGVLSPLAEKRYDRWAAACKSTADARDQLNKAECELTNATNELGRFLVPAGAKEGERVSIWHGSMLVDVTKAGWNDYRVAVREAPPD